MNTSTRTADKHTLLFISKSTQYLSLLQAELAGNFLITHCRDDQRALAVAASKTPPAIILLDGKLPDSLELSKTLKSAAATRNIPLIYITDSNSAAEEARCLEYCDDCLSQPINPCVLRARLRNHLARCQAQIQLQQQRELLNEELKQHSLDIASAKEKLEHLVRTGIELGQEHNRMALLRKILMLGKEFLNCDIATLFLISEDKKLHFTLHTTDDPLPDIVIPLYKEDGTPNEHYMSCWCVLHNQPVIVDDVYKETRFDLSGTKKVDASTGYRSVSVLTMPLSASDDEVLGVLQFLNFKDPETNEIIPFPKELLEHMIAMAAQAAVALHNHRLIASHQQLLDAIVKLLADAIDAKSSHTGGHCARVPELGMMLAEAACEVEQGPLADFHFASEAEWTEFRIGAWLHDCGKLTTSEFVVEKASKLEMPYNRIHEIRMRFEVLLRDARIEQLESIAAGGDATEAQQGYERRYQQLQQDFALIAESNLGGEQMADDKIEAIRSIAKTTWLRHFDDRLGLAHEELGRYPPKSETLPALEHLLSDKPQHIEPRLDTLSLDPCWGFKIDAPEHLNNFGELHNLSIRRGTLTAEERFQINEHVMQTLMMLEQLPLPANMRRIPGYAGTHHETLTGSGYPRKLDASQLSIPMRIMAIADVFEALTASDRPYKKAKTLSESIDILAKLKQSRHIDADLFALFLRTGIYQRYADTYLKPEQIDTVDISAYLD